MKSNKTRWFFFLEWILMPLSKKADFVQLTWKTKPGFRKSLGYLWSSIFQNVRHFLLFSRSQENFWGNLEALRPYSCVLYKKSAIVIYPPGTSLTVLQESCSLCSITTEIKVSKDLMAYNKHFCNGLLLRLFFKYYYFAPAPPSQEGPWVNHTILTDWKFPTNCMVHCTYILHGNRFSADDKRQSSLRENAFKFRKWNLPL